MSTRMTSLCRPRPCAAGLERRAGPQRRSSRPLMDSSRVVARSTERPLLKCESSRREESALRSREDSCGATMPAADDSTTAAAGPLPKLPDSQGAIPHHDNAFDLFMISAFRMAMGRMAGWQAPDPWVSGPAGTSYSGLVKVSRRLFAGSPTETTQRVKGVLAAFPTQPQLLRNNKPSYEILGWLTPMLFTFLVGKSQTETWEDDGGTALRSKVVIEKCRFLEGSSCKGMCVNLCKRPTEEFFNEELGLSMSMAPNFETGGCELVWGKAPADLDDSQDLRCYVDCSVSAQTDGPQTSGNNPINEDRSCSLLDRWSKEQDYVSF